MSGEQKTAEAAYKFAESILGEPVCSPDDTIVAGFMAGVEYADQQNAALKESLAELIETSQLLYIAVDIHSFGMPGVIQNMPKYKAAIDRAKKLLNKPNDSAQNHTGSSSDQ